MIVRDGIESGELIVPSNPWLFRSAQSPALVPIDKHDLAAPGRSADLPYLE